ncbi:Eco57I restriction-modification methylase domain-containing protein [Dietzia natronolimnaea]|uniref:Eco57I restriction-modification methylase domain-containing protein n=1 Tax=Dietzia natronolimnaea TaxID=161920 RepID=UPI0015F861F5|nr:DNA methyltransferase [Dietzia natronolimnaea]MBB1037388.1 N-6 DNA methylase [Dietzia natronolimnaea]
MASLFGRNALKARARAISTDEVRDRIAVLEAWLADYETGTLKTDTETSRQGQYTEDVFGKVLGYRLKPASPYTFEPQVKTSNNDFPDGVIRYNDSETVSAVVEFKGASVNLDKPQRGKAYGNLSPVQQAFKYKPAYSVCPFVIVSNFYEFRLYNDNQLDFERWTLHDLVDTADDYINFKQWYFLLRANNFVAELGKPPTELFLSDIRQEQMDVGEEFYAEYSEIRLELLRDLWRRNPERHDSFDVVIQKAQTIIDRIVFVCFAEDSGLLPDHTLTMIVKSAKDSPFQTIWEAFKTFFHGVGVGSEKLGIPNGYGGALFADDANLDSLEVGGDVLLELASLGGKYDFENDLTVTVLGRIFEQSITDLEEIREKVQLGKFGEEVKKEPGRRKKEGVYYTPDYVVRYVVERTVGDYLRSIEEELKDKYNLSGVRTDAGYERRERQLYMEYQSVLESIRVIDPACGSGAFLVGVFDYLLAEHDRVAQILGTYILTSLEDSYRAILTDNIYGVDLNEESVELTKLSLWLKTALKDKDLTDLDENIKCGNSLISRSGITDRPFNWEEAFPRVFSRGGFHVVVGNPPYVRVQNLEQGHVDYFFNEYEVPTGKLDISIIFFEKALQILRRGGRAAFISSSQWMQTDYGANLRKLLSGRQNLEEIIDFGSLPVFEDASTYPAIYSMSHNRYESVQYARIASADKLDFASIVGAPRREISYVDLSHTAWSFGDYDLVGDLKARGVQYRPLSDVAHAYVGDITGHNETFVLSTERAVELGIEKEILFPFAYRAAEVSRWSQTEPGAVVIYPYRPGPGGEAVLLTPSELESRYPVAYAYLHQYKEVLEERLDSRKKYAVGDAWFRHLRAGSYDYIEQPKLIIKGIDWRTVVGFLSENSVFNGTNCPGILIEDETISMNYMWGLLNSHLIAYALNQVCPPKLNNTFRYNNKSINRVPIVGSTDEAIETEVARLAELVAELETTSEKFKALITYDYGVVWPDMLVEWWLLDYPTLARRIKLKAKLGRKAEFIEYWEGVRSRCQGIAGEILLRERVVDERVYEIYGLDEADIAIVDGYFEDLERA